MESKMEINEAEYKFIKSLKAEDFEAIQELLGSEALSLSSWIADKGVTPLHLAVGYGREPFSLRVTLSLLEHGSDPNSQSSCGKTSVHVAVAWGRVKILQLLLLHGGDPWQQDDEGKNAFNYAFELEAWDVVKVLHDVLLTSPKRCCRLSISPVQRHEYPTRNLKLFSENSEKDKTGSVGSYVTTSNISISHVHEIHLRGEFNEPVYDEVSCNEEISLSFHSRDDDSTNISETADCNKTYTVDVESPSPTSVQTQNLFTELISAVRKRELRISGIDTLNSSNETPVMKEMIKTDVSNESAPILSFNPKTWNNHESSQNLFTELISAAKKRELRILDKLNSSNQTPVKAEEITVDISEETSAFLSFNTSSQYESCEGLELPANGKVTIPEKFGELREKLQALGMNPGPITESTKGVYQRQLERLLKQGFTSPPPKLPPDLHNQSYSDPSSLNYSPELINAVSNPISTDYTDLEKMLCSYFSKPEFKGSPKTCFNYLLLDSRKTLDLPRRATFLSPKETLSQFLAAIFYIGKGQAGRPYAHLRLAKQAYNTNQQPDHPKEQAIVDAWRTGHGIICFQVFHSIIAEEALTREAAMIHALGRQHLHNQRKGDYHGCVSLWDPVQQRMLGVHLLLKAKELFLRDEERPLFPGDF